jgi:hypothetical protein
MGYSALHHVLSHAGPRPLVILPLTNTFLASQWRLAHIKWKVLPKTLALGNALVTALCNASSLSMKTATTWSMKKYSCVELWLSSQHSNLYKLTLHQIKHSIYLQQPGCFGEHDHHPQLMFLIIFTIM